MKLEAMQFCKLCSASRHLIIEDVRKNINFSIRSNFFENYLGVPKAPYGILEPGFVSSDQGL